MRMTSLLKWLCVIASSICINAYATDFVLIPAGSFTMGDTFSEGASDERPTHSVYVSAFYMESTEVTKAQWDSVYQWATNNGYSFDNAGSGKATNHPVHTVNWYDCVKWCNARSERDGLTPCYYSNTAQTVYYKTGTIVLTTNNVNWSANGYRLPTEAEWEKAARGGVAGHRFPWSDTDTITHSQANYYSTNLYAYDTSPTRGFHPTYNDGVTPYTSPTGSFAANGYGLYDMAGNLWEWCWDWFNSSYYSSSPGTDPRGAASGSVRAGRGGGWSDHAKGCRPTIRYYTTMNGRDIMGFRCARSSTSSSSPGTLQFSASSASVNENAGSVRLSVTRSGGSSGAANVNYATADSTAVAGSDYTAKSRSLSWSDGQSDTKTVTINVNAISGGSKYFYVNLSSASGATLGSPAQSTVTIEDNAVLSGTIISLSGYDQFYVGNSITFKCVSASGLTCMWDFSGNGQFTDASGFQASYAFSSEGSHKIKARLSDGVNQYTAEYLATIGKAPESGEPTDMPAPGPEPGNARNPLDPDEEFTANSLKKDNGLIIIVHGVNDWAGQDWVTNMANAISSRLVSNGKPCPNIMAWDWKEMAIVITNVALSNLYPAVVSVVGVRGRGHNQGQQLAVWIEQNITAGNINANKPIHIIGHSAGGWVAGGCVNEINRKIDQITTLDTPVYSRGIVTRYLLAGDGRQAEMYTAERTERPYNVDRIPSSFFRWLYHGSLYWSEVTTDEYDTHGGIPYWYYDDTINPGLEQNGFWYSPWLYPSGPLPIKMTQKNDIVASRYHVAKQAVSDFQTFGSVSVADGVWTITEGAGNAGIYKSTAFPSDATAVMFEYKFTQAGDGDFLSVHVGTNEAVFIGEENDLSRQSFVLGEGDLSTVTGTTAILTFKLISRGEPNAQVQLQAIEVLIEPEIALAPGNVTASDGTFTDKVRVSWDASSGATNYEVWRNTSDSSNSASKISSPDPTGTSYDDTSATAGTTYYYWVKAVNAAGASAFSASDSGFIGVVGPLITANGLVGDVYLNSGDAVTIAVQMMNMEPYIETEVDWWVVALDRSGGWYYLNNAIQWTPFNGDLAFCQPVYQGPLFNLSSTPVLSGYILPLGTYDFWFAVDYPMDDILNLSGPILYNKVTVIVQ